MESFRDLLKRYGEGHPPQMRWDGTGGRAGFLAWQERFMAAMNQLRQELPRPPARVEVVDVKDMGDHVREHVRIDSVVDSKVPAYILVPKNLKAKAPGVLALHGHHRGGKEPLAGAAPQVSQDGPDDYGLASVRAGFVTLCPDWWGWGERVEEGFPAADALCDLKFQAAQQYGLATASIMISDGQAALEALAGRPEVDPARIATLGHSTGGRMSMWLAAMDRRISCAVCSGCLNCFRERSLKLSSCGAQVLPGLLRYGDVEEVFSLIAPRPMLIMVGRQDPIIDQAEGARMKSVIEAAYRALDADTLEFHYFEGRHVLPQEPAIRWLAQRFAKAA